MKFFVIIELLIIAARVTVSFFDAVPKLAQDVLTGACVVVGVVMCVFIGISIYKDLKRK